MYPPGQFRDTVERIEKLCHSRRMNVRGLLLYQRLILMFLQVSLSVWRDEAHGLIHGKKVEDDQTIELDDGDRKDETVNLRSSSGSVRAEYASSSSPPQTRPPSSEVEDDDDFDIDAVIRAEVERNARKRAEAGEEPDHLDKGKGKMVVADEDEYDALWNEMDPIPSVPASVESSMVAGGSGDDDMVIWDAVDALEKDSSAPTKPPTTYHVDDDEDMWDVVQEMENAPTTKAPPIVETSTENTTVVDQPPPSQDDDDDWEDMYV
jgi:replication fork protection complex subunit Csm3/Swi3